MIWLSWRQQRTEAVLTAAMLALVALVLVLTGRHIGNVYDQLGLAHCAARPNSSACTGAVDVFGKRFSGLMTLLGWFNLLPALIGILFAAPLLQELEHATYRLSWTQGITRRRWIATKLGGAIAATLLATLVLTLLTTWWRGPFDHIQGRMDPNNAFDFEGLVPYAYALFALALVLAIGTVSRRLITAVAGGIAGFLALRLSIQVWVRHSLIAPVHFVASPTTAPPPNLAHAWVLQNQFERHSASASSAHFGPDQGCFAHTSPQVVSHCMAKLGFVNDLVYQPDTHFWPLQGIEGAIFVATAVGLLALTGWWIRRRIA